MAEEMVINNIGIEQVKAEIKDSLERIEEKWIE
jgi:hypothetical protein